ncbi:hypothetical protein K9K85_02890 [Patescibacteria group bacterium]|nr:hypothetical protein [Patescibacteria group bacterium]
MNGQKIFVGILTVLNLIWLGFSIFVLFKEPSTGLIMMIPLAIGLITFFITKKVKKFDTFRAFKYASIAFFIPAGIIFVLGFWYIGAGGERTAGVAMIDPLHEQCYEMCRNTTQEITNATRDCINNCLENLRNK